MAFNGPPPLELRAAPRVTPPPRFYSNAERQAMFAAITQPFNPPPQGPQLIWPAAAAAAAPAAANINMTNSNAGVGNKKSNNNMNVSGGRRRSRHAKKTRRNKRHAKKTRRNRRNRKH